LFRTLSASEFHAETMQYHPAFPLQDCRQPALQAGPEFSRDCYCYGVKTLRGSSLLCIENLRLLIVFCLGPFWYTRQGVTSVFDKYGCALIDTHNHNDILASANLRDNLYWILDMVVTPVPEIATPVSSKTMSEDITMWHNRLAHVNRIKLSDMIRDKHLPPDTKLDIEKCTDCSSGKQTRDSFKGHIDKATKQGAVVHSDVVGPLPHSVSGACYFLTVIDEFTRFVTALEVAKFCGLSSDFSTNISQLGAHTCSYTQMSTLNYRNQWQ
jgi:hypothetical protein